MNMLKKTSITVLILCASFIYADQAAIYEKTLVIPTYGVDAPDINPRFYDGRVYQGAQGRIYPYPISDVLTNQKEDKSYQAVYLENDYLRLCVLPEIGGRIFEAVDRSNNYNFFYKQSVIKPSLIGMLGAWISGGVEWNFPHHHRARTFMPMEHTLIKNDDGSVTLAMTELDYRHRLQMLIELTLRPESNIVQVELKFINPTPFVHSILYFANPSVHVDSTYQVLFPPEVQYVVQHAKREFAQWPIADTRYGGYNYENVDISWWKNLPDPVSFFAWSHHSDYFGGYDHGKRAGVAYVADSNLAPGKKFFTFGCGHEGKMWDIMLTDDDGPYLELMAGAYSDNQPDYSWIQPFETKIIRQNWFPIRQLEGLSYANLNGALYLNCQKNAVQLNINTTTLQKNALVKLSLQDHVIYEQPVMISPAQPFAVKIPMASPYEPTQITASLYGEENTLLLTYTPIKLEQAPMPEPVKPPTRPADYQTNEELYLTGLRLDEFHNPQIDSYPYYFEALKRDSSDIRVNTQLGILYAQRGMWKEAERHLYRAGSRLSQNYTRPKDGEALYYLGLVQRRLQKNNEAYDSFYRAGWNFAWRAAAFYMLAEMDCCQGNYLKALEHIDEAIAMNEYNTRAKTLKAVILRQLQRPAEAKTLLAQVLSFNPLEPWTSIENEHYHQPQATCGDAEMILEVATHYAGAGFFADAEECLRRLQQNERQTNLPQMLWYDLAFYQLRQGKQEDARATLQATEQLKADYFFPFRLESLDVLTTALELRPQDALAHYAMGNLLYDWQPEKAIDHWKQAVSLKPQFSHAFRNLGYGTAQALADHQTAISYYEQAIKLEPNDARLFYELDVLYEAVNTPARARYEIFKKHAQTIAKRDDAVSRWIHLLTLVGQYDTALNILKNRQFNVWEGAGGIHDQFVNAHLLRGLQSLNAKKYQAAEQDFYAALDYPENLQVGRPIEDEQSGRTWTLLGQAFEAKGDKVKARECYLKSLAGNGRNELAYYRGLSLAAMGKSDEAKSAFQSLIDRGKSYLERRPEIDFFAKFGERSDESKQQAYGKFLLGLGQMGLGNRAEALQAFSEAAKLDSNNLWVNYYFNRLGHE